MNFQPSDYVPPRYEEYVALARRMLENTYDREISSGEVTLLAQHLQKMHMDWNFQIICRSCGEAGCINAQPL